jgi:Immunity protein 31
MNEIAFYDVVHVSPSPRTLAMGIDNRLGVILGRSGESGEGGYAVLIGDYTYMVDAADLVRTGEKVTREQIYSGEAIRVEPERHSDGGQPNG